MNKAIRTRKRIEVFLANSFGVCKPKDQCGLLAIAEASEGWREVFTEPDLEEYPSRVDSNSDCAREDGSRLLEIVQEGILPSAERLNLD